MTERKPEYFRNYRPITINWFTGWWLSLPLWKIWKSVGIIIPNIWKKCKMFQTTNQFQMIQIQEGKWKVPDIWQRPSNVVRCHLPGSPCHSHSRAKKMRSRGQRVVPMDLGALSAHIFQWIGRKFQPETRKPGILPKLCRGDFLWFPLYMFSSTNSGKFAVVICGYHRENRELKLQNPVRISMQPQWGDGKSKPLHSISKPERTWLSFIGVPRNDHPGKRSKILPRFPRHFLVSLHVVSGAQSCDVQMVFACQLVVGGLEKHWEKWGETIVWNHHLYT